MANVELNHAGYTILRNIDDSLISTASVHEVTSKLDKLPRIMLRELYELMVSIFLDEDLFKDEVKSSFWSPVFIRADNPQDSVESGRGICHYTSTKRLLMEHNER